MDHNSLPLYIFTVTWCIIYPSSLSYYFITRILVLKFANKGVFFEEIQDSHFPRKRGYFGTHLLELWYPTVHIYCYLVLITMDHSGIPLYIFTVTWHINYHKPLWYPTVHIYCYLVLITINHCGIWPYITTVTWHIDYHKPLWYLTVHIYCYLVY